MRIETDETAERKLLEAALLVIERDGIEAATSRAIAKEAGANPAAINYYFRSKDALVRKALQMAWDHAIDDFKAFLAKPGLSPRDRLASFLFFLLDGGIRFPRITEAHMEGFEPPEVPPTERGRAWRELHDICFAYFTTCLEALGIPFDERARHGAAALLASIFQLIRRPWLFVQGMGLDYRREADRRDFVESGVDSYLGSLGVAGTSPRGGGRL